MNINSFNTGQDSSNRNGIFHCSEHFASVIVRIASRACWSSQPCSSCNADKDRQFGVRRTASCRSPEMCGGRLIMLEDMMNSSTSFDNLHSIAKCLELARDCGERREGLLILVHGSQKQIDQVLQQAGQQTDSTGPRAVSPWSRSM